MESNKFDYTIDNNILLVSEKEQKAYLPYKYFTLEEIYKSFPDKYNSVTDVIHKLYEIPLNKFSNSSISRFREGFKLMRHKQKESITKSLDLGLELMFNYSLNPIIIAACRSLDELDLYLDCLEQNELDKFDCFEIKFEVTPQVITNKNEESKLLNVHKK